MSWTCPGHDMLLMHFFQDTGHGYRTLKDMVSTRFLLHSSIFDHCKLHLFVINLNCTHLTNHCMSMTIFIKFIIHMMAFCHADDTHDSEPRTWAGHGTQDSLIRRCPNNKVLRPKIQDIRTCPGHVQDMSRTLPTKFGGAMEVASVLLEQ